MTQKGFTLIEAVVSAGIFSAAAAACFFALIKADLAYEKMTKHAQGISRSLNYVERLFSVDYDLLSSSGPLKVIILEPGLKLLILTGESGSVYLLRSLK